MALLEAGLVQWVALVLLLVLLVPDKVQVLVVPQGAGRVQVLVVPQGVGRVQV